MTRINIQYNSIIDLELYHFAIWLSAINILKINGEYIKKYLPELKLLPKKYIHEPWKATSAILKKSDIRLGEDYPLPIINHKFARDRALEEYKKIRNLKKDA